jgi:hypothetical protein
MQECCNNSSNTRTKFSKCPVSHNKCSLVPSSCVQFHIKNPHSIKDLNYYFCSDPECEVVYFSEKNHLIKKSEIKISIGVKEQNNKKRILCYCFSISYQDFKGDIKLKEYVVNKTKSKLCNCILLNPSSKCCLRDFPKSISENNE